MKMISLDFESHYSQEYTLKSLTTEEYIRNERFQALVLGYYLPDEDYSGYVRRPDIPAFLDQYDPLQTVVLHHHAHFDGLILSHHYGYLPARFLDTLSMARLHFGASGNSLEALAKKFNFHPKIVPYNKFIGKHWEDLDDQTIDELGQGAAYDAKLTFMVLNKLIEGYPTDELRIIDMTVKAFTNPRLVGDHELFFRLESEEVLNIITLLNQLSIGEDVLSSNDKFTHLLQYGLDIDVPTKLGKGKEPKQIPQVAAKDPFMQELLASDDETLRELAEARIMVRSTLKRTRCARLGAMSQRGALPVYLNYCGAHTTRWSGGDSVNLQNLPRKGEMRHGLRAPKGYLLVIADKSQIEARLLAYVAGQRDLVEKFRCKEDPYVDIASKFYGRQITKADVAERGTGKQLILSCGYGAGALTIQRTARLGTYGPPVHITMEDAERAKVIYRSTNREIVKFWHECDRHLPMLAAGLSGEIGGIVEYRGNKLYGPNDTWINYNLAWDDTQGHWYRKMANGGRHKLYGTGLVENIIQFLARVDISDTALRIKDAIDEDFALTSHDEMVYIVPEDEAENVANVVGREFRRSPTWLPDLPLDAEVIIAERYEK